MMGLIDAFRRVFSFFSLYKIKRSIDALSDEQFVELLAWMQDHFSDVEVADPDCEDEDVWRECVGQTWY
jgi:hypothetical protein